MSRRLTSSKCSDKWKKVSFSELDLFSTSLISWRSSCTFRDAIRARRGVAAMRGPWFGTDDWEREGGWRDLLVCAAIEHFEARGMCVADASVEEVQ